MHVLACTARSAVQLVTLYALAGAGVAGVGEHERNRHPGQHSASGNTGYGSDYQSTGTTGNTGSGYKEGSGTQSGGGVKSKIPGTAEYKASHNQSGRNSGYGSDYQSTGTGNTGSGYNQDSGNQSGGGIKSNIPGTAEYKAKHNQGDSNIGHGSDSQHTGSGHHHGRDAAAGIGNCSSHRQYGLS